MHQFSNIGGDAPHCKTELSHMLSWQVIDSDFLETEIIPDECPLFFLLFEVKLQNDGRLSILNQQREIPCNSKVCKCYNFGGNPISPHQFELFLNLNPFSAGDALYNVHPETLNEDMKIHCKLKGLFIFVFHFEDYPVQQVIEYSQPDSGYDLFLKTPEGLTFFEHNARKILCKELKGLMTSLGTESEALGGFKISKSHFRLGSKIHISDFYYAKRFFQNNNYASRFAFLIAKEIQLNLKSTPSEEMELIRELGLSLIGYGLYSEMLITQVARLLTGFMGISKLNHNLISDEEDLVLIKKYSPIYARVVMIIPISSTFSTSIKIEEALRILKPGLRVLEPHLNIINVYDTSKRMTADNLTINERKFGWKAWEEGNRTVVIRTLVDTEGELEKRQRYFLRLPTTWYDIQSCKLCFGARNIKEQPLFITDKTSLTPALIFATPKGRNIKENSRFVLENELLSYGHYESEKSHYLFYIQKELFFDRNKSAIGDWLHRIAGEETFRVDEKVPIIIIAPGNYTNAGFVNMVNDIVFKNRANIIHYDPTNDHIQNFSAFYGEEIGKAIKNQNGDSVLPRVIFVDDTLVAGSTFITTNYFVKHTINKDKGFDACIVMLDRSSHFVHANIIRKLSEKKHYYAFANLHLSSISDVDNSCPLCKERERYEKLAGQSFLDKLRIHFLTKSAKLKPKDPNLGHLSESKDRNIRMLEGTHLIYEWFSCGDEAGWCLPFKKIETFDSLDDWAANVFDNTVSPFERDSLGSADVRRSSDAFLKILTQSPFTRYKPVKEKVFNWVRQLLEEHINFIKEEIKYNRLDYHAFRQLKFLIRRAGLLNMNFLISVRFMEMLTLLLSDNGIKAVIDRLQGEQAEGEEKTKIDNQIVNLRQFHIFYAAQLKELLFLSEARSVKLERVLIKYGRRKGTSTAFRQLIRILREENGILLQQFHEFISKDLDWQKTDERLLHFEDSTDSTMDNDNDEIIALLNKSPVKEHYHFKTLKEFLEIEPKDQVPVMEAGYEKAFLDYLFLQRFLGGEKARWEDLNAKTSLLMEKLKQIVLGGIDVKGAFFAVRYKSKGENKVFFAYNEGNSKEIREFGGNDLDSYFVRFMNGLVDISGSSKYTLAELIKDADGGWRDMYAVNRQHTDPTFTQTDIPQEYNRLLLLRISKQNLSFDVPNNFDIADEPQGVICFYFKQDDERPTDVSTLRYLLLLRSAIGKFIEDHHEQNEFRDLIEANARNRAAMLTGHGSEMLFRLYNTGKSNKFREILATLTFTQRFIIDMDGYIGITYPKYYRDSFVEFFNMKTDLIDYNYFNTEIRDLAEKIFESPEIENPEELSFTIANSEVQLHYSKNILESICFELFLNAKKNRYIFLHGEEIVADGDCGFGEPGLAYRINHLHLELSIGADESPQLKVINTAPKVDTLVMNKLMNDERVKNSDKIAGIELIKTMLQNFNFGEIRFNSHVINDDRNLHAFEVGLTLTEKTNVQP